MSKAAEGGDCVGENVPLSEPQVRSPIPGPIQSDILGSLELVSQILEAQHFARLRFARDAHSSVTISYDIAIVEHARKQLDYAINRLRQALGLGGAVSPGTSNAPQYISVNAGLKSATELLRHRLQQVLVVEWLPSDLPKIFVNPDEFREICYNLLLNAILGLGGRMGRITVEAITQMPTENWPGGVRLRFVDSGQPVNENYLHLLFKPNFFLDRPRRIDGLLLYVTHRLAEKNRGRLVAYGCCDTGTAFCIDLPSKPLHPH
ncbi:MAG: HAMP domain-containing histidine kinase [Candidatus Omnitrophica bacterium]|nr:HAMP domain-containing histidine kinase [Candidatus Omnitrophota bacterium]